MNKGFELVKYDSLGVPRCVACGVILHLEYDWDSQVNYHPTKIIYSHPLPLCEKAKELDVAWCYSSKGCNRKRHLFPKVNKVE